MSKSNNIQEEVNQLRKENRQLVEQIELLNKKLVEAEEFKSHFLSNVTNEIVNPFSSVIGLSQQIMGLDKKECHKASELAALIYAEASSLDFQLRNIFVAARLEAGEETPEFSKIDIPDLVNEVVNKIQHEADKKHVLLRIQLDKQLKTFVSDKEKLELILLNLLSNAVNFSETGKEVSVKLRRESENLVLEVVDKGIGMTQEEKERIFDRFHRANPRIQSVSPGSGLGLAVVEGLLFLLNGKTEVETAPGKGTKVHVIVPEMDNDTIEFEDDLFFDETEEESF